MCATRGDARRRRSREKERDAHNRERVEKLWSSLLVL